MTKSPRKFEGYSVPAGREAPRTVCKWLSWRELICFYKKTCSPFRSVLHSAWITRSIWCLTSVSTHTTIQYRQICCINISSCWRRHGCIQPIRRHWFGSGEATSASAGARSPFRIIYRRSTGSSEIWRFEGIENKLGRDPSRDWEAVGSKQRIINVHYLHISRTTHSIVLCSLFCNQHAYIPQVLAPWFLQVVHKLSLRFVYTHPYTFSLEDQSFYNHDISYRPEAIQEWCTRFKRICFYAAGVNMSTVMFGHRTYTTNGEPFGLWLHTVNMAIHSSDSTVWQLADILCGLSSYDIVTSTLTTFDPSWMIDTS